MAQLAFIAAENVRRRLAARIGSVVTDHTAVDERCVVDRRRLPRRNGVTTAALECRHYVCRRLTRGERSVMAARTRADHLRMIHALGHDLPHRESDVTGLADIRRCQVRGWILYPLRPTRGPRDSCDVTQHAVVGDIQQIMGKRRGEPSSC